MEEISGRNTPVPEVQAEVEHSTDLVLPQSGELIDLTSEKEVALALAEIQALKGALYWAERRLREVLAERSRVHGTKTFQVAGVGTVEVKADTRVRWDEEKLERLLREAGAPEEMIREIVIEVVSYKVDARRASRAAKANPEYAYAIESSREEESILPTVSISK